MQSLQKRKALQVMQEAAKSPVASSKIPSLISLNVKLRKQAKTKPKTTPSRKRVGEKF